MAAALALFLIPVHWQEGSFALDWEDARKIPWGVLALFGGGFSLAAGLHQSGAAAWVGDNLSLFKGAPVLVLILAVCLMITFLTEVTSNSATATIMMPIMAMTAVASGIHPFLLMLPATLSASCAFMLPAATPPNAIVFGSGLIRLPQMARAGLVLNLVGAILVTGFVYYLAGWAFGMDLASFPAWAEVK
jgi:sodium-dependent dicarboxylate transporter 2/3/5